MSLHNFLLFHLRSHIKNSCFVFHQGFQTPRNNKSTRPTASCFHYFLGVWNPWWNTRTRFWYNTSNTPGFDGRRWDMLTVLGRWWRSPLWQLVRRYLALRNIITRIGNTGRKNRFDVRQMQSKCGSNMIFVTFVGIWLKDKYDICPEDK